MAIQPALCCPCPANPVHPDQLPSPPGKHSEGGSHCPLSDWHHLEVRIKKKKKKCAQGKEDSIHKLGLISVSGKWISLLCLLDGLGHFIVHFLRIMTHPERVSVQRDPVSSKQDFPSHEGDESCFNSRTLLVSLHLMTKSRLDERIVATNTIEKKKSFWVL